MTLTATDVARAFSSHDFDAALPVVAEQAVWTLVGADDITGGADIAAACRATAAGLAGVRTTFSRFVVVADGNRVVVDSVAEYAGPDSTSVVASCDIYEFENQHLIHIRSYNIELP